MHRPHIGRPIGLNHGRIVHSPLADVTGLQTPISPLHCLYPSLPSGSQMTSIGECFFLTYRLRGSTPALVVGRHRTLSLGRIGVPMGVRIRVSSPKLPLNQ